MLGPASTVLIADDYAAFRQCLHAELQEAGFERVVEASDGLEAVAKAAELQPALILLDIGMPRLDGLKAAAQIRSLAPHSKILFVSNQSDPDIIRAALSAGGSGYLCKRRTNSEFLQAVEAVLQGKRFLCSACPPIAHDDGLTVSRVG